MTSVPDAVSALHEQLLADLAGVAARIEGLEAEVLESWPTARKVARRRLLTKLRTRVGVLAAGAAEIARAQVEGVIASAYRLGAAGAALTAGQAVSFTGADLDAIASIAQDTYDDVLRATQNVRSSTKDLVRTLARDHVTDAVVSGEGQAVASRRLAADLAEHRITAITYVDGSRHGLRDYTDMLVRTKTAEAHQEGGFAQARVIGIEWMEIMDGPGCGWTTHNDAKKANGLIVTVDEAARWPLSHPRCRRVASPRPDVGDAEQARTAKPIGPQHTAEEIAAHSRSVKQTPERIAQRQKAAATRRTVKARKGTMPTGVPKAARAHQTRTKKATIRRTA